MPRVKAGTTRRQRHKAILATTKGHRAARSRRYRVAKESMLHALDYATRHRKLKKRQNRSLAITRINAAAREHGISYSALVNALKKAEITLDRKSLAELAIRQPSAFAKVVETAKESL